MSTGSGDEAYDNKTVQIDLKLFFVNKRQHRGDASVIIQISKCPQAAAARETKASLDAN